MSEGGDSNSRHLAPKKCVLIQGCPEIQKKLEDKGIEVLRDRKSPIRELAGRPA